jgi:uncharacterized membrane protein YqgA involved in biofilm formation
MIGTWVNFFAIILGSILGLILHRGISAKISTTLMKGLGLCIILIGISGAVGMKDPLVLIVSMALGAIIGEWIDIEKRLEAFGSFVESKFAKNAKGTFAQGFIMASLVFAVGAMAIVGAIKNGLYNDPSILYTKSLLDFIGSIVFASTMGIGVMFSAFVILVYQGSITLLSIFIQPWLNQYPMMIIDIGVVGSVVIIGLGLKMMKISDIKVANLIPAIFMPILIHVLLSLI